MFILAFGIFMLCIFLVIRGAIRSALRPDMLRPRATLPLPRLYVAPRVQFDLSVPPPRVARKN